MDIEVKSALELFDRFLVNSCARPFVAADRLSCIVGVVIDVKPACVIDFTEFDTENMDLNVFERFLESLGLKFIYEKTELNPKFEPKFTHTYFISKKLETAQMLVDAEQELYDHFDTDEPNSPVIKVIHRKIGRLLGYPETATDWFLIRTEKMDLGEMDDDEVYKDLQNFYHFIHSRHNSEEEFEEYDKPIHEAMEKYTPLSAQLLRENAGNRRWL
ncbi:hypothetical protein J6X90_01710 [Candidatus Saccharibacteria bacterium]|nr:hypothetical protein [Candidatus Saccharibacteria bacterium]